MFASALRILNLLIRTLFVFESFKVYSLFSYQGSLLFSATLISYHKFKSLSTTFLILFLHLTMRCCRFATACIYYQTSITLSTTFFKKIEQLIFQIRAEKEGFEPSRRSTRPIPLAGAPLRPLEYFSKVII